MGFDQRSQPLLTGRSPFLEENTITPITNAWTPSAKFCASSAHTGWATAAVLVGLHEQFPWWLIVLIFTIYALLKEYVLDLGVLQGLVDTLIHSGIPRWLIGWLALERDSVKGSTLDFVTYEVGIGIGHLGWYYPWLGIPVAVAYLIVLAYLSQRFPGLFQTGKILHAAHQ